MSMAPDCDAAAAAATALPFFQAGTWYMDRKNEVPVGKENYYVLPIANWHEVRYAHKAHL
jgi:hypothetical protein